MPIEPDGLRLSKVLDGRTNISGELSGDAAETVTTALNAFMDPPSVIVDWATLTRSAGTSSGGGLGLMDGQYAGPIDRGDIERLLRDSTISRVIMGPDSKPLDVGRSQRAFTDPQRKAIIARDQHCGWAGCEIPGGWCEIHHHTHWKDGGLTCIENGCLLCPHHHRFLHRHPNWTTTYIDQVLCIYRPDATEVTPNPWNTLAA